MKEQDKTPEERSGVETGGLPEKEFKVMLIEIIQDLRKRIEAQPKKTQKMVNKEPEDTKNKQTGLNNTITELKNILEGVNSRINEAEK